MPAMVRGVAGRLLLVAGAAWLLWAWTAPAGADTLNLAAFPYARRLDIAAAAGGPVRVRLDAAIWAGTKSDLGDLRLVDEQGQETPYRLDSEQDTASQQDRWQGKITGRTGPTPPQRTAGGLPSYGTSELQLDLGGLRKANHLWLTADDHDYWKQVNLQSSTDGQNWTAVPGTDYIYDFHFQGLGHRTDLVFPDTTFRFLKVTITNLDTAPLNVTLMWVTWDLVHTAPTVAVPASLFKVPGSNRDQTSQLICDLGDGPPPVHQLTLDSPDREFHRYVYIEASDDQANWQSVGTGVIYRYDLPVRRAESLTLRFAPGRNRYLRLTLRNGYDTPLNITRVDAWSYPRTITFRPLPSHSYTLYYGAHNLSAANYPPDSFGSGPAVTLTDTALGPQFNNPFFSEAAFNRGTGTPLPTPTPPSSGRVAVFLKTPAGLTLLGVLTAAGAALAWYAWQVLRSGGLPRP